MSIPTRYQPTPEDLKGLFNHRFETSGGLVIDCYLSYEKEEKETRDEPGNPANMELVWALVGGIDISEVLEDLAETIEVEALEELESQIKDAAFDRGEA
jgi:hypothetical protein